ncbi:MAG: DNA polymerase IV, partial [Paracoccaceae bacterium]|nr:DNA polymerase IV [Paracoccaceae bacterium]
ATQSADRIYRTARSLMDIAEKEGPFRLIGVGISNIVSSDEADRTPDLLDPNAGKRVMVEKATDEIRKKFGAQAILKGRSLR